MPGEVLAMGRTLSGQIPTFCCCGFKSPGCEFQVKLPRAPRGWERASGAPRAFRSRCTRQLPAEVSPGKWNPATSPLFEAPLWASPGLAAVHSSVPLLKTGHWKLFSKLQENHITVQVSPTLSNSLSQHEINQDLPLPTPEGCPFNSSKVSISSFPLILEQHSSTPLLFNTPLTATWCLSWGNV